MPFFPGHFCISKNRGRMVLSLLWCKVMTRWGSLDFHLSFCPPAGFVENFCLSCLIFPSLICFIFREVLRLILEYNFSQSFHVWPKHFHSKVKQSSLLQLLNCSIIGIMIIIFIIAIPAAGKLRHSRICFTCALIFFFFFI